MITLSLHQLSRLAPRDKVALMFAARDRRTPWYAQLAARVVRFIDVLPVLSHLTEVLFVPLAVHLIPPMLWEEYCAAATQWAVLVMSSC